MDPAALTSERVNVLLTSAPDTRALSQCKNYKGDVTMLEDAEKVGSDESSCDVFLLSCSLARNTKVTIRMQCNSMSTVLPRPR
jgi:hypothetical protein